jgi:hypothetical protein
MDRLEKLDLKCLATQLVLTLVVFYVIVYYFTSSNPQGVASETSKHKMIPHDNMLYVYLAGSIIIGNIAAALFNNGCPQKSSLF